MPDSDLVLKTATDLQQVRCRAVLLRQCLACQLKVNEVGVVSQQKFGLSPDFLRYPWGLVAVKKLPQEFLCLQECTCTFARCGHWSLTCRYDVNTAARTVRAAKSARDDLSRVRNVFRQKRSSPANSRYSRMHRRGGIFESRPFPSGPDRLRPRRGRPRPEAGRTGPPAAPGRELDMQIRQRQQLHHPASPRRTTSPKPFLMPQ